MLLALLLCAVQDLEFLKDYAQTRGWTLGAAQSVRLTPDGKTALFLRALPRSPVLGLHAFDVATGTERELITPEQVLGGRAETLSAAEAERRERMRITTRGFTSYDLSDDGRELLVTLSGAVYVVSIDGGSAREVVKAPAFDPKFSPDGKCVSFVRDNELWLAPVAGGAEKQITHGASAKLTHARAEFVAEEELGRFTGYWWSPDSQFLVYEEADLSGVEQLYFSDLGDPAKKIEPAFYPRPGKPNAKISFGIVPAKGGKTTWIQWDKARFEYVARVDWRPGAPLTMHLLSRDQRDLSLVQVTPSSGKTHELLHERDDAWVSVRGGSYQWLADGSGFLWGSERSGEWQLELRKPDGALVKQLTPDERGFDELAGVSDGHAYFSWAPEPPERQIARVPLQGGPVEILTKGSGLHEIALAKHSAAHVLRNFGPSGNATSEVIRADGTSAGALASVAERAPFESSVEIRKAGDFWCAITRPRDFDARKKYPVIHWVYGGPGVNTVVGYGRRYLIDQWFADHGYIVVHSDGRGTPGRGREWERRMLHSFATVPLEDQVAALQAMAAIEPAMDLARVGVIGHSFGGFEASLSVMKHPEIYKAAVAGGTVVDWMNYDTTYTERYLGIPPPAGTSDAYARNGLLPYAAQLTRPILLIHGTADDNVHFSETLLLSDALFKAGKKFELLPLVNQTHQFHDPPSQMRYWQRIFDFFAQNL